VREDGAVTSSRGSRAVTVYFRSSLDSKPVSFHSIHDTSQFDNGTSSGRSFVQSHSQLGYVYSFIVAATDVV
jgi:hypothetical protein